MFCTRRNWLIALSAGAGLLLPKCVFSAATAHRPVVPERSKWSTEQLQGREKLERYFRRGGIPLNRREQSFEGLVVAAREGKRGRELFARAGEWCRQEYGDFDWEKLLKLLQFAAAILTILMLFI